MSECCVKFLTPVSRETINHLVIEYLKYVLYYRGQFPLPLDQLIRTKQIYEKTDSTKIGSYVIHQDENIQQSNIFHNTQKVKDKTKQVFIDSVNKFDKFFNQLLGILQNDEVLEVIMSLGPNMLSPRELHRITLPTSCSDSQYVNDPANFQRYRLEFFKTLLHSAVLQDLSIDNPIPISILLRLKSNVSLKEYMEQKRFYVPPKKCKQILVCFSDTLAQKDDKATELKYLNDQTVKENIASTESQNLSLWVKLKSELKGFKNLIETQTALSNHNVF